MYKKQTPLYEFGKLIESRSIIRIQDNACIPFDLANTDYQQYLVWFAEGNTPLPAEI